jgi:cytochrome c oxidase subunit 4
VVDGGLISFVLAYYVAFGPHGPRAPVNPPGTTVKIFTGVSALIGAAGLLYVGFRAIGTLSFFPVYDNVKFFLLKKTLPPVTAPPPPKTITKEWEEASNERAKELKINPISGP